MDTKRRLFLTFWCLWLGFIPESVVDAFNKRCKSNTDCVKFNEICSRQLQQCSCKEGTIRFGSDCVGKSQHGDRCRQQSECSRSGDGHLHCIGQVCECGNERIYDQQTKKCEEAQGSSKHNGYRFNKMTPHQPRGSVVKLDDEFKDINNVR